MFKMFKKSKVVEPEKKKEDEKKPSHTYYHLGLTDDNRVSLSMGYSSISMNRNGVDTLIDLLNAFKEKLPKDEVENSQA